jgi:hypothetical protein
MYISINSYSTACQKLLLSVCEELLLPVPVELGGSPISMSPHDVGAEESPSSTTCEETNDKHSLPNEMPTSVSSNTRSLVRCASFQDKRQITVPSHKQKVVSAICMYVYCICHALHEIMHSTVRLHTHIHAYSLTYCHL